MRLEFPILSLNPGLRPRCVAPEPLAVRYRPFNRAHCLPEYRRNRAGRQRPGHTPSVRTIHLATHRVAHLRRRWRYCMGECEAVGWSCCYPRNRVTLEHDLEQACHRAATGTNFKICSMLSYFTSVTRRAGLRTPAHWQIRLRCLGCMSLPSMIRVSKVGSKETPGSVEVGLTIRTSSSLLQSAVFRKKRKAASFAAVGSVKSSSTTSPY